MPEIIPSARLPVATGAQIWAMTSYYNSAHIERRRENFTLFRANLGVPLIAVEQGYDRPFELMSSDADILIQIRGGDPMWQKERLLNLALDALPANCRYVAWLDCDVIFARTDWPELAVKSLQSNVLVQLFRRVRYLKPEYTGGEPSEEDVELSRWSIPSGIERGLPPADIFRDGDLNPFGKHANGFAWAARRELMDCQRFFDTCIVGGGDRAMIAAALDCVDHIVDRQRMTRRHADLYRVWAKGFRDAVGGAFGWIEGDLFHLWHGPIEKRQQRERYRKLARFDFDPTADITLTDNGIWRWSSDKPEMHAMVRDHLAIRCGSN